MREEIYGQDILLDGNMQASLAATGEAVTSDGIQTVLQDIKLRLFTPLGSLFYDKEFGSRIIEFVKDENTMGNRLALIAEIKSCINAEPRVVPGKTQCKVESWDHTGVVCEASFEIIDETHPFNLIIDINSDMEIVIKDVNPG
ncbi:MAG: baseplate assembly protein [Deltaproteobacteria bacterium]|nr:baseplate assembly protein [Deltaproteobacteria bacterium]